MTIRGSQSPTTMADILLMMIVLVRKMLAQAVPGSATIAGVQEINSTNQWNIVMLHTIQGQITPKYHQMTMPHPTFVPKTQSAKSENKACMEDRQA
jgi:hypothetical protein